MTRHIIANDDKAYPDLVQLLEKTAKQLKANFSDYDRETVQRVRLGNITKEVFCLTYVTKDSKDVKIFNQIEEIMLNVGWKTVKSNKNDYFELSYKSQDNDINIEAISYRSAYAVSLDIHVKLAYEQDLFSKYSQSSLQKRMQDIFEQMFEIF